MSSLYALVDDGHERIRLPIWNEYAYLDVSNDGPWAYLFDVGAGIGGGDPIPFLMHRAAEHDTWEPWVPVESAKRSTEGSA